MAINYKIALAESIIFILILLSFDFGIFNVEIWGYLLPKDEKICFNNFINYILIEKLTILYLLI